MKSQWTKIENPFDSLSSEAGFNQSPFRKFGVRLEYFFDKAENVVVCPVPSLSEEMAGFPNMLHGGLQAVLHDEILFMAVFHFTGKVTMLGSLKVQYTAPAAIGGSLVARSRLLDSKGRKHRAECWMEVDGTLVSSAEGIYILPRIDHFRKALGGAPIPPGLMKLIDT